MNLTHTGLHRFFRRVCRYRKLAGLLIDFRQQCVRPEVCRYRKLAGLLIRRPRYRLLCGDCGFCMGACGRAVKEQARENGSGALSL